MLGLKRVDSNQPGSGVFSHKIRINYLNQPGLEAVSEWIVLYKANCENVRSSLNNSIRNSHEVLQEAVNRFVGCKLLCKCLYQPLKLSHIQINLKFHIILCEHRDSHFRSKGTQPKLFSWNVI